MATNFPASLDALTNPSSNSSVANPSHAQQHADANDAIEALEAKVGITGSAVTTSHDYKIAQLESLVTSSVAGAKSIYQDVRNQSGSSLSKATPVYVSGSEGASGKILISAASNAAESTSSKTMGITTSAIANNSNGQVISEGILEGIDTTGAVDGDPVWLGIDGAKIYGLANKPSAPAHLVFLGVVIRGGQANTGSMYVKIQNGFELQELHNVQISSLLNGNILAYDSTSETWKNTNTLQSTSSTTPLVIKGSTSQSANIVEVQLAGSTQPYFSVTSGGNGIFYTALSVNQSNSSSVGANYGIGAFEVKGTSFMRPINAAGIVLITRGAASQTGNLQEWQESTGAVRTAISAFGVISHGNPATIFQNAAGGDGRISVSTVAVSGTGLIIRGVASQTANLQEWQDSAGSVKALIGSGGNGVFNGLRSGSGSTTGAINAYTTDAQIGILVRGAASQTANLQEWQLSNGFSALRVLSGGSMLFGNSNVDSNNYLSFIKAGGATGGNAGIRFGNDVDGSNQQTLTVNTGNAHLVLEHKNALGAFIVKGATSQTANLQEWQDSAGTVFVKIDSNGHLYTSNKGIYLNSSYVGNTRFFINSSATTMIGAIIKGAASQTADLQQWKNSAGTDLIRVSSAGRLVVASDSEAASSMITTSQPAISSQVLSVTSTSADYGLTINATGSGSGTSVGLAFSAFTTTGYNGVATPGGAIWFTRTGSYSVGYLSLLTRSSTGANDPLVERMRVGETGTISIAGFTASSVGLIVKGATSQSANLQEWQNSAGGVLLDIDSSGSINIGAGSSNLWRIKNQTNTVMEWQPNQGFLFLPYGYSNKPITIRGAASQTGNLTEWQNSAGTVLARFTNNGVFYPTAGIGAPTIYGTTLVSGTSASGIQLTVKGAASQTANLQEWQDSSGTILTSVSKDGFVSIGAGSNTTYSDLNVWKSGEAAIDIVNTNWKSSSGRNAGQINFRVGGNTGERNNAVSAIRGLDLYVGGSYLGGLSFLTQGAGSTDPVERARITNDGYLLINTTSISAQLASVARYASVPPLVIQHAASPTSSYFEIRNSSGTAIWGINSVGEALTRTTTKFGANIQNDSNNNNNSLTISAPSSGGTGIALYVNSGSATRDIAKFDNSGIVKLTITSDGSLKGGNSSTISANTATTVDTVELSSFTTIEYVVSIKQGSKIRSSKVLVHTDGTSVDSTEYGIMEMGGGITGIIVTASVSGTDSILQVTITDAATTNATVKLIKTML